MSILEYLSSTQFIISTVLFMAIIALSASFLAKYIRKISRDSSLAKHTQLMSTANDTVPAKVSNQEIAAAIEFKSTSGDSIKLKRIDSKNIPVDPNSFIQLPTRSLPGDSIAVRSAVSRGIAALAQPAGIVSLNPNGLFTATANPAVLTKLADGTFSTMIHGPRGIASHAGFNAASASVFAPIIVFQAMSMVTGQYYLNGITRQLKSIDKKVNKLIELHHATRLSKISYTIKMIDSLYKTSFPNIEDLVALRLMQNDIGVIHEEYVRQISNINLDDFKHLDETFTKNRISELFEKVADADFDFSLNMAITTDEILHMMKIVELVLNTRMGNNIENRARRVGEILNEVKEWDSDDFFRVRYGSKPIGDLYSLIIKRAKEIYEKAIINEDKAGDTIKYFEKQQSQLMENIGGKINVLEMGKALIEQFQEPVEILYYVDSEHGDKILVKKVEEPSNNFFNSIKKKIAIRLNQMMTF